ncbi:MAG: hypothetical protein L0323_22135 [Planctomycetes bacterium]|nr:hypothetical protein [Planctomycetota bacterium]
MAPLPIRQELLDATKRLLIDTLGFVPEKIAAPIERGRNQAREDWEGIRTTLSV